MFMATKLSKNNYDVLDAGRKTQTKLSYLADSRRGIHPKILSGTSNFFNNLFFLRNIFSAIYQNSHSGNPQTEYDVMCINVFQVYDLF